MPFGNPKNGSQSLCHFYHRVPSWFLRISSFCVCVCVFVGGWVFCVAQPLSEVVSVLGMVHDDGTTLTGFGDAFLEKFFTTEVAKPKLRNEERWYGSHRSPCYCGQ